MLTQTEKHCLSKLIVSRLLFGSHGDKARTLIATVGYDTALFEVEQVTVTNYFDNPKQITMPAVDAACESAIRHLNYLTAQKQ